MTTIINKIDTITSCFTGQADLITFASITDAAYASAELDDLTTPQSLGDIFEGSTSWTGEDATLEAIKNEQGAIVCSRALGGTFSFEFTAISFSASRLATFLKATTITNPSELPTWLNSTPAPVITGFGDQLPIVVCPIALLNQDKNKWLIFPKARIVSNIVMDGNSVMIKSIVEAISIKTTTLNTVMLVDGVAVYETT